jgi:hypothetical protein
MARRVLLPLLAACAAALAAEPAAAQSAASRCTSQKYKAAGQYARALARCRAQAVAKGVLVHPDCLTKALAKLEKAFAKAEQKGDCLATGDLDWATSQSQDYVGTLPPILESRLRCCTLLAADECTWVVDEAECDAFPGGTLGPPGSFCDGAGDCVAPPASPGFCCDGIAPANGCVGGDFDATMCANAGGAHAPSKLCMPSGECRAP